MKSACPSDCPNSEVHSLLKCQPVFPLRHRLDVNKVSFQADSGSSPAKLLALIEVS